ncbi:hypothetical protein EXU30_14555 [Shewanella maritima]|uniref:Trypsin-co-occurring domain-containing protein n=1 Tax=Shewanella maritima TaxID=2520507 RepID=A0A411PJN4_9GAMM|nr:CU044_2847 family protein [Shewanella maritima]QBF83776.1 hypothetical protein EXU30_14555 [Shewanella maritima]
MNKVVELEDGLELEVFIPEDDARLISSGSKVQARIDDIQALLSKVITPISNTYKELNKSVSIAETKVSLGVKLSMESGFVVAKCSSEAHIQIEMTLRESEQGE